MSYYTVDDLRLGHDPKGVVGWRMSHFLSLDDALTHYASLPATGVKSLGLTDGVHCLEIARCVPLFEYDREGEDILASDYKQFPLWAEGDLVWYQNLDNGQRVDSCPVLDNTHGTVYCIEADPVFYSNDPEGEPVQIIRVDIIWGALSYTYQEATWNANTHTYDGAGWTVDDEAGNAITVANNGTLPVTVSYAYQAVENGISGSFADGDDKPVSGPVALPAWDSTTVWLLLEGKPERALDQAIIGSVTVTIGGESE